MIIYESYVRKVRGMTMERRIEVFETVRYEYNRQDGRKLELM